MFFSSTNALVLYKIVDGRIGRYCCTIVNRRHGALLVIKDKGTILSPRNLVFRLVKLGLVIVEL